MHKTWDIWERKVGWYMTRSPVIVSSLKERLDRCPTWQQANHFISARFSFPRYKSNWLLSQSKFGDSQLVNACKWLCKHKVVLTRELSLLHYCLLNNQELNFSLNIYKREGRALMRHKEKTTKNKFSVHALLLETNCVKSTLLKKHNDSSILLNIDDSPQFSSEHP